MNNKLYKAFQYFNTATDIINNYENGLGTVIFSTVVGGVIFLYLKVKEYEQIFGYFDEYCSAIC